MHVRGELFLRLPRYREEFSAFIVAGGPGSDDLLESDMGVEQRYDLSVG